MIRCIFIGLLIFLFIANKSVHASDFPQKKIENHTLKISKKFSKTYCNTFNFGISENGSLNFAINETIKEFSKNKLNKFINYKFLKEEILLSLENYCNINNFNEDNLEFLDFN